ncbi:MgtC/SapB family protein [Yinghuangia sp. ASG 101]|uniref:MgtC/SapB family protein n=1 Tax=Yinghuangia sp. ASG 101 TaxID=2896848 RepID=UPI003FCCBD06
MQTVSVTSDWVHGAYGRQVAEVLLAFVLSSAIGVEREVRQRSAGLRTHALVGVGTALFVEVSKYGFWDVLPAEAPSYDPSRIAAQIVSGIGFIGGGLIFVRRDSVRGLTTAAVVWLTCAVGMACAAGLPVLAILVTALHFAVVFGYTPLIRWFEKERPQAVELRLVYMPAHGVLPAVLMACVRHGFRVTDVSVRHEDRGVPERSGRKAKDVDDPFERVRGRVTYVVLRLDGTGEPHRLVAELTEMDGVLSAGGGVVTEPE